MANGDYGYFGKGSTGYAQYMTAFNRNFGGSSGGGGGGGNHNNNGGGGGHNHGGGGGRAGAHRHGRLKESPQAICFLWGFFESACRNRQSVVGWD